MEYLDQARGILISFVVLGHVISGGIVRQIICVFHVPAFFMISGILFSRTSTMKKPIWELAIKKARALLVPYLFFDVVYIVYAAAIGREINIGMMLKNTLCLNSNVGSIWFLHTLFFSELLFFWIHKTFRRDAVKIGIPAVLACAVFCFERVHWQILIGRTWMGLLFITIGYYAAAFFTRESDKKRIASEVLLGAIPVIFIGIINGTADLWGLRFGNPLLYLVGAVVGSYVIIQSSRIFVWREAIFLGKNTMVILGTHKILIEALHHFSGRKTFGTVLGIAAVTVILIAELPIILFCNRFIPQLVGKPVPTRN